MTHAEAPSQHIAILMPLMNDWELFDHLFADLDLQLETQARRIDIHIVDDYSIPRYFPQVVPQALNRVYVTRLVRNLGHQRAIAVGLVYLAEHYDYDCVVVMDSDGEDCPMDVNQLLAAHQHKGDHVIVAQRKQRSEGLVFRTFYAVYKRVLSYFYGQDN